MDITVVGTGYVGLVAGACLADAGHYVYCVDKDESKIKALKEGRVPIYEPGLADLIAKNASRLCFTTELRLGKVVFLAVGTPTGANGQADLSSVFDVARQVGQKIGEPTVIVDKSTVPIGTGDKVQAIIQENLKVNYLFAVVSNPEFLKEGHAIEDFMRPDRVVLGVNEDDDWATSVMESIYLPFVQSRSQIVIMDRKSAELSKYAANAMLATRISFMNEISRLCDKIGANIDDVRRGIGSDSRIGPHFLYAGIGFGGSCFPKDIRALLHTAQQYEVDMRVAEAAYRANERQKVVLAVKVYEHFKQNLHGKNIAVWGLAFKPGTDDVRESPALVVIDMLRNWGAKLVVYDPEAMKNVRSIYGDELRYAEDMYDCATGAEALVICTEWREFRRPDYSKLRQSMEVPVIFDGKNALDPNTVKQNSFVYYGTGR